MALINPSIALSFRPTTEYKPRNLLAEFAQLQQIESGLNQNALAQYTLSQAKRVDEQQADLFKAARQPGFRLDYPTAVQFGPPGIAAFKAQGEAEQRLLERDKTQLELAQNRANYFNSELRSLSPNPSDDNIDQTLTRLEESQLFSPAQLTNLNDVGAQIKLLPFNQRAQALMARGAPAATPTSPQVRDKAVDDLVNQTARNLAANPTDEAIAAHLRFLSNDGRVPPARMADIQTFTNSLLKMPLAQRAIVLSGQGAPARAGQLLSPEEEAQKTRIAIAGRTPPQQGPLEQVVDKDGNVIYVTREAAVGQRPPPSGPLERVVGQDGNVKYVTRAAAVGQRPANEQSNLTAKERQTREAMYPKATAAVNAFEAAADKLANDLEALAAHPGLASITGMVAGRVPGITADGRRAEALYNNILARGGFQELTNLRQASPTGSALGNQSNQEGQYLRDAFGAIARTQDAPGVITGLQDAAKQIRRSKANIRETYDLTYEYRNPSGSRRTNEDGVDYNNPLWRVLK